METLPDFKYINFRRARELKTAEITLLSLNNSSLVTKKIYNNWIIYMENIGCFDVCGHKYVEHELTPEGRRAFLHWNRARLVEIRLINSRKALDAHFCCLENRLKTLRYPFKKEAAYSGLFFDGQKIKCAFCSFFCTSSDTQNHLNSETCPYIIYMQEKHYGFEESK